MSAEGELRPERECAGFRGTTRYASINSHTGKDLSRRDDLWSIFYILVEFVKGSLPWRRLKDKDKVGEMKLSCTSADFLKGLPPELNSFIEYLQSLQFQDQPDYSYLKALLHQAIRDLGGNDNSPFPWENVTPPPWVLSSIPSRTSRSEVTEISTITPSREYSRGGTADLMATSDSHEKSSEYRLINRETEVVVDIVTPLSNAPRLLPSGSNSALAIPDTKHQHQPNTNVELDVGGDDIKCGFVELDLSEKTKNFDLPRGRRRMGGKLKKQNKDSSKSISSSKKRKKPQEVHGSEHGSSKCNGCNIL